MCGSHNCSHSSSLFNKLGKLETGRRKYADAVDKLSKALEEATLEDDCVNNFRPVPSIGDIQHLSRSLNIMNFVPSYMACGPRRVGKTTAMLMAFKDTRSVLYIQPDSVAVENFYASLMNFARLKDSGINKQSLVQEALIAIKKGGEEADVDCRSQ